MIVWCSTGLFRNRLGGGGAATFWDEDTLGKTMRACIIMHNMIDEDEHNDEDDLIYDGVGERVKISHDETPGLEEFIKNYKNTKKTFTISFKFTSLSIFGNIIQTSTNDCL